MKRKNSSSGETIQKYINSLQEDNNNSENSYENSSSQNSTKTYEFGVNNGSKRISKNEKRVSAQRFRQKRKSEFESLKENVKVIAQENEVLMGQVQELRSLLKHKQDLFEQQEIQMKAIQNSLMDLFCKQMIAEQSQPQSNNSQNKLNWQQQIQELLNQTATISNFNSITTKLTQETSTNISKGFLDIQNILTNSSSESLDANKNGAILQQNPNFKIIDQRTPNQNFTPPYLQLPKQAYEITQFNNYQGQQQFQNLDQTQCNSTQQALQLINELKKLQQETNQVNFSPNKTEFKQTKKNFDLRQDSENQQNLASISQILKNVSMRTPTQNQKIQEDEKQKVSRDIFKKQSEVLKDRLKPLLISPGLESKEDPVNLFSGQMNEKSFAQLIQTFLTQKKFSEAQSPLPMKLDRKDSHVSGTSISQYQHKLQSSVTAKSLQKQSSLMSAIQTMGNRQSQVVGQNNRIKQEETWQQNQLLEQLKKRKIESQLYDHKADNSSLTNS